MKSFNKTRGITTINRTAISDEMLFGISGGILPIFNPFKSNPNSFPPTRGNRENTRSTLSSSFGKVS